MSNALERADASRHRAHIAAGEDARAPSEDRTVKLRRVPLAVVIAALMSTGAPAADFIAGADFSHLGFFEDRGIVYREGGEPADALAILKRGGLNCVRLRLFTSSAEQARSDAYNFTNNLEYTLLLAARVKRAGLQLMLDFHYSDSWADPGKQNKPAAWAGLNFTGLEQRMYDYNSNTIAAFKAAGAMPEYVQVGNEIISGMLWPEGRVGGSSDTPPQWTNFTRLVKAAIRGIKDAAGTNAPKIIIHIDRGGDWGGTQWFFDNLVQRQVDFDIIGESYYPWWHGSLTALRTCLNNAANKYGKPLIVIETAFPWTNSTNIVGIPASPEGQTQFVTELAKIIKAVPNGRGIGICWWGTEYVRLQGAALAGFDRRSFFDYEGNALPVVKAVGQLAAPVRVRADFRDSALTLQWPLSGAALSLASSTNLTHQSWERVTNSVQSTGAVFSVTLDTGDNALEQFYRLQSN
jgi:arabinogalactan endo-1,4-beta-galactosidase